MEHRTIHPSPIVDVAKLVVFAILLSAIAFIGRKFLVGIFLPVVGGVWLLALLLSGLVFVRERFTTLEIGEHDLLFKRGILTTKTVLVSYEKITDTRYTQSLSERIFGVGTFEADTAGSNEVSIRMPSVRYEDVEDIIGIVRKKPHTG